MRMANRGQWYCWLWDHIFDLTKLYFAVGKLSPARGSGWPQSVLREESGLGARPPTSQH